MRYLTDVNRYVRSRKLRLIETWILLRNLDRLKKPLYPRARLFLGRRPGEPRPEAAPEKALWFEGYVRLSMSEGFLGHEPSGCLQVPKERMSSSTSALDRQLWSKSNLSCETSIQSLEVALLAENQATAFWKHPFPAVA